MDCLNFLLQRVNKKYCFGYRRPRFYQNRLYQTIARIRNSKRGTLRSDKQERPKWRNLYISLPSPLPSLGGSFPLVLFSGQSLSVDTCFAMFGVAPSGSPGKCLICFSFQGLVAGFLSSFCLESHVLNSCCGLPNGYAFQTSCAQCYIRDSSPVYLKIPHFFQGKQPSSPEALNWPIVPQYCFNII